MANGSQKSYFAQSVVHFSLGHLTDLHSLQSIHLIIRPSDNLKEIKCYSLRVVSYNGRHLVNRGEGSLSQ
jgi:hypothetical protein